MSPGIWSQNLGSSSDTVEGHPIIIRNNEGGTQPGAGGDPQGKWSQPSTQETQVAFPFFHQRSLRLEAYLGSCSARKPPVLSTPQSCGTDPMLPRSSA